MTNAIAVAARATSKARSLPLVPMGGAPAVRLGDHARVNLVLVEPPVVASAAAASIRAERWISVDFGQALHRLLGSSARRAGSQAGRVAAIEPMSGGGLLASGLQWTPNAARMIDAGEYRYIVTVLDRVDGAGARLAVKSVSLWNDLTSLNLPAPASTTARECAQQQAVALAEAARAVMAERAALGGVMRATDAVRAVMQQQARADACAAARGDCIVAYATPVHGTPGR